VGSAELQLESTNDNVAVPSLIVTDPGQSAVPFRSAVRPGAGQESAEISVQTGDTVLRTTVEVAADAAVAEAYASGDVADPLQSVAADVARPAVLAISNAASHSAESACSPGAIATLSGSGFQAGDPLVAPAGDVTDLAGTRVIVNGAPAPVLYAGATRVDFLCPAAAAGTPLGIIVETAAGSSDPAMTMAGAASPGIFLVDGSGQGLVLFSGTSTIAGIADYRSMRRPAHAGDVLSVRATGIGSGSAAVQKVLVRLGGFDVASQSVQAVEGPAGEDEVTFQVPSGVTTGDAVPLSLLLVLDDGRILESNSVAVAIAATGAKEQ
jgi:uncharacterized protein (TIGR03437 family)